MAVNFKSEDLWLTMEVEPEESSQQGSRKNIIRFNCCDDIMLLRQVIAQNPFRRGHSKEAWECVASNLHACIPDVSSRTCKERSLRLLKFFKADDMSSLRRSGTDEQYAEIEQLLQEIKDLQEGRKTKPLNNVVSCPRTNVNEASAVAEFYFHQTTSLAGTPSTSEDGGCRDRQELSSDDDEQNWDNCSCSGFAQKRRRPDCSTIAEYLTKKHAAKMASKDRDRQVRLAELEIETRKVAIEERKMVLEAERWKEEKEDRREQRKMIMELIRLSKKE